jgi:hypothetical protein
VNGLLLTAPVPERPTITRGDLKADKVNDLPFGIIIRKARTEPVLNKFVEKGMVGMGWGLDG